MSEKMLLDAQWTDDCCGKKDYDGTIIAIDTRYWPRGHVGQDSKPSATCSVTLRAKGDSLPLIKKDFSGESFDEIKAHVEPWAQAQMDRVVNALMKEFEDWP